MNFLKKISELCCSYNNGECITQDNVFLYGVRDFSPPLAKHIVFSPMPKDVMQNLVNNYNRMFPTELLTIYNTMNGAELFCTVRFVGKKNTPICRSRLSIYGVPLTYERNRIEPFNISVEDLNRPKDAPDSWLKFGSYYRPENVLNRLDLFVDTDLLKVYAVEHEDVKCHVAESWDSIDSCLCCVFDLLTSNQ